MDNLLIAGDLHEDELMRMNYGGAVSWVLVKEIMELNFKSEKNEKFTYNYVQWACDEEFI
jgi:hypothetical protein